MASLDPSNEQTSADNREQTNEHAHSMTVGGDKGKPSGLFLPQPDRTGGARSSHVNPALLASQGPSSIRGHRARRFIRGGSCLCCGSDQGLNPSVRWLYEAQLKAPRRTRSMGYKSTLEQWGVIFQKKIIAAVPKWATAPGLTFSTRAPTNLANMVRV